MFGSMVLAAVAPAAGGGGGGLQPVLNFSSVVLVRFLSWFGIWVLFGSLLSDRVSRLPLEGVVVPAEPAASRRLRSWLARLCECVVCELKLLV